MEPGFCPSRHEKERMLLLDYCSGELEPVEAAALRGHIEGCPDCAAWVEAQERVVAWMGEWEAPAVSAGFDQALAVQMAGERPAPWWRRWFAAMELRPAAAVAAVCVILAAGILLDRMPSPVAPEQAGIEAAAEAGDEAERVEQTLEDLEMLRVLPVSASSAM